MADEPWPPLTPEQEREEAETRAMLERAERAWQRQIEREEAAGRGLSGMTRFRWLLAAVAAAALILILAQRLTGTG